MAEAHTQLPNSHPAAKISKSKKNNRMNDILLVRDSTRQTLAKRNTERPTREPSYFAYAIAPVSTSSHRRVITQGSIGVTIACRDGDSTSKHPLHIPNLARTLTSSHCLPRLATGIHAGAVSHSTHAPLVLCIRYQNQCGTSIGNAAETTK